MGRGLLDRLSAGERHLDESASILGHLRALLNSHQGGSETAPAFGLPDLVDILHNLPDGMGALEQALRATIEAHEPRLSHVRVRHLKNPDSLRLHFQITARLASDPRRALRIRTRLDAAGRFHVDGG